ncbi:hypothetical protein HFX_1325 [Haloferax mediterranei ATCC 33500]|uniref:Uncharacterized protein n=1 Tax=Haloferax mediterranei (strain ATCC 33500 / DSM 1411 / JCM 8866 / NBRC 14739 / NCIMB 2177 / R-4) TaxID=523841 RepID=I3R476_HALMT|nr:hypothetical protein HFX_1325 [Haloferax mediterranei ATCC 33500]
MTSLTSSNNTSEIAIEMVHLAPTFNSYDNIHQSNKNACEGLTYSVEWSSDNRWKSLTGRNWSEAHER